MKFIGCSIFVFIVLSIGQVKAQTTYADIAMFLSSELDIPLEELVDANGDLTPRTAIAVRDAHPDVIARLQVMIKSVQETDPTGQSQSPKPEASQSTQRIPSGTPKLPEARPLIKVSVLSHAAQVLYFDKKAEMIGARRLVARLQKSDGNYQKALDSYRKSLGELEELEASALTLMKEKKVRPEAKSVLDAALMDEIYVGVSEIQLLIKNSSSKENELEIEERKAELVYLLAQAKGTMTEAEFAIARDIHRHDVLDEQIKALSGYISRLHYRDPNKKRRKIQRSRKRDEIEPLRQKVTAYRAAKSNAERGVVEGLGSLEGREPLIPTSAIKGAAVKLSGGGQGRFDSASGLMIISPPTVHTYLVLNDGSVIGSPGAPSDFNLNTYKNYLQKKGQKLNTRKEILLSDDSIYPALKRGYRLNFYGEYNTPGTGGPTLRSLLLREDGQFRQANTRLVSTQNMGTGFGRNVSGENMSGTYFIDGNTIELRYKDGNASRMLFGSDGKSEVLLGSTQFVTPNK